MITNINYAQKKEFSKEDLKTTFLTLDKKEINLSEILEKHKNTIIIEIWASWCTDCVAVMPDVKELQKKYKNVEFIFISMDKSFESWIQGIEKFNLTGEHYFSKTPWKKSKFAKSINLDWIPRFMVVNPNNGNIKLFKATKPDDKTLIKLLKQNNSKTLLEN